MHKEAAAAELDGGHADVGGHIAAAQALLLLKAPHAPALHLLSKLKLRLRLTQGQRDVRGTCPGHAAFQACPGLSDGISWNVHFCHGTLYCMGSSAAHMLSSASLVGLCSP